MNSVDPGQSLGLVCEQGVHEFIVYTVYTICLGTIPGR